MNDYLVSKLEEAKPLIYKAISMQEISIMTVDKYLETKNIKEPKENAYRMPNKPSNAKLLIECGIFAVAVILAPILLIIGLSALASSSGDSGGMTAAFGIAFAISAIVFGKKGYEEYRYLKSEMEKYNKEYAEAFEKKDFNENVFPKLKEDYIKACKDAKENLVYLKEEADIELEKLYLQINDALDGEDFSDSDYEYVDDIINLLQEGRADSIDEAASMCRRAAQELIERSSDRVSEMLEEARKERELEEKERMKREREREQQSWKEYREQQATMQRCVKCIKYPKCKGIPNCGAFVPRR